MLDRVHNQRMSILTIRLFGHIQIEHNGQPVELKARKALALLAWLVVDPHAHDRERLATMFWPDADATRTRANLRRTLWTLNQTPISPWIDAQPETVALRREDADIDIVHFVQLFSTVSTNAADPASLLATLTAAVDLYTDDFLADFTLYDSDEWDGWARDHREHYRRQVLTALHTLTQYQIDHGDFAAAVTSARRHLAIDNLDEAAHQQLLLALAQSGQRTTALTEYENFRRLLAAELDVPPSSAAVELIARIRSGAVGGGAPILPPETQIEQPSAPSPTTSTPPATKPIEMEDQSTADRSDRTHVDRAGEVPLAPASPYRGLFAFREEDDRYFFGREDFVDQLLTAAYQRSLVAVVGPSGSGKSSVIHAGLVASLRREPSWIIANFRPSRRPFQALAGALIHLLEAQQSETERLLAVRRLADALEFGDLALLEVVDRILEQAQASDQSLLHHRFLLVVDQFEELYTLVTEAAVREHFLDTVLSLVFDQQHRTPPHFTLVFTLRADFLGQMLDYRPLADALTEGDVKLGPMTRPEMTRAIVNPAHLHGVAFEAGLVARILDDVRAEPGHLPLLQFALEMLWAEQEAGQLTHRAYEEIGKVAGALARHADGVYNDLNPTDQALARRIFIQVVRPGLNTEDTRRLATRTELGDAAWALVQRLSDSRLLVTNLDDGGNETVEVVHEALIHGWQWLQEWMQADRDFRLWQERLRGALAQWEVSQHDEGALLRGRPLAEAEDWLAEREGDLSVTGANFIRAGIELRNRRADEAAAVAEAQHQQELIAAQALAAQAEARRLAEAQQAQEAATHAQEQAQAATLIRRRARWLAGVGLAAIVLAIAAAIFGAQARRNAQQATAQAQLALVRQLGLEVNRQEAIGNYDVALLLAIEAVRRADKRSRAAPETMADLHRLLNTPRPAVRSLGNYRQDAMTTVLWTRDGKRLVTTTIDGVVQIWDAGSGAELQRLTGHQGSVRSLGQPQWDNDERRLLTSSDDGTAMIWDIPPFPGDRRTDQFTEQKVGRLTLTGHTSAVTQARWSPDNQRIATVSTDMTLRIWDATTGAELLNLRDGDRPLVPRVRWSADSRRLLTTGVDGIARVWDAQSGDVLLRLVGHSEPIFDATWSHAEDRIATAAFDGTARIWDAQSGELLHLLTGHQGAVRQATWSKDDALLLTYGFDGTARLWATVDGTEKMIFRDHTAPLESASWSPDEELLVTTALDGTARVWDVQTSDDLASPRSARAATLLAALGHGDVVFNAAWDPAGQQIATASRDGLVRIWQWGGWQIRPELPTLEESNLNIAAAQWDEASDELFLVRTNSPPRVYRWKSATGAIRLSLQRPSLIHQLDWSQDRTHLLTAGGDAMTLIWDAATGEELRQLSGHSGDVLQVQWSHDETRILTAGEDGTARIWDSATSAELVRFADHSAAVTWARWNQDDSRILTAGEDQRAFIWDASTGKTLLTLAGHSGPILQALWNQEESRVLTTSDDGTARLWDVSTLLNTSAVAGNDTTITIAILPHQGRVEYATWSRDDQRILTASMDGQARIWDGESQGEATPLLVFNGDAGFKHAVWNGDETLVAALDRNSQVWIWDAAIGALRQRIAHLTPMDQVVEPGRIHFNLARVLWTHGDQRLLVLAGGVYQFYTRLDDLVAEACRRLPRNLTPTEWQQIIGDVPYRATCPDLPLPEEVPPGPPLGPPPIGRRWTASKN